MDVYHAWFNLKENVPDLQFAEADRAYLELLKEDGQLVAYRDHALQAWPRPA